MVSEALSNDYSNEVKDMMKEKIKMEIILA
jgi:hypothetical protein